MAGAVLREVLVSLFVAGVVFGEVQVSLFVAGAVLGEMLVSLFVAGAVLCEVLPNCRMSLRAASTELKCCKQGGDIFYKSILRKCLPLQSSHVFAGCVD